MMAKPMKTLELHYPMIQFLIIKIILVQGFCPLKTEVARFPIGFRVNVIYI